MFSVLFVGEEGDMHMHSLSMRSQCRRYPLSHPHWRRLLDDESDRASSYIRFEEKVRVTPCMAIHRRPNDSLNSSTVENHKNVTLLTIVKTHRSAVLRLATNFRSSHPHSLSMRLILINQKTTENRPTKNNIVSFDLLYYSTVLRSCLTTRACNGRSPIGWVVITT